MVTAFLAQVKQNELGYLTGQGHALIKCIQHVSHTHFYSTWALTPSRIVVKNKGRTVGRGRNAPSSQLKEIVIYSSLCKLLNVYANLCNTIHNIRNERAYKDLKSDVLSPHLQETLHHGETSFHHQHTKCQHWLDACSEYHTHVGF